MTRSFLLTLLSLVAASRSAESVRICWERDLKPIVERHCAVCHNPAVPDRADLEDFRQDSVLAYRMHKVVEVGGMPPGTMLPDSIRAVFRRWHEEGPRRCEPSRKRSEAMPKHAPTRGAKRTAILP
ncbi:MAG: hypothetical protein H6686_13105 [Fibrobacteria bacterium]|nr:hypothetical protein [Fibrobacteria bacterium]